MAVKRSLIPVILVAAFLLGGAGCMNNNSLQNNRQINDVALAYMEQKYGEKFEYAAPWGDSMSGIREFLARCDSLQDQDILVQIENYRQDDKIFRDNYLAVKYRESTIAFFRDCAEKIFGEATIFYEVSKDGLSTDLLATATLDDFLADTRVPLVIMAEIKRSNFESRERAEEAAKLIATCGANFYLTIAVVEDDDYGTYNRDTLNEQIASDRLVECASIIKRGDIIETVWSEKE